MHLLEEVPLAAALGVTNRRRVRGFGDQHVRPALVNPSGTKMAVRSHVVVALSEHTDGHELTGTRGNAGVM